MSTLPIDNAKKFTDLSLITEAPDSAVLLIHDGTGVKQITAANLKADIKALVNTAQATIDAIAASSAGAHNAIFRGKYLGSSVTDAQYAAIAAGTFDDMYIGDYWTIGGVNYRIAAFDYYLTTGDTACSTHHVTVVPDTSLYSAQMNSSNITTGAYIGSEMYTTNLETAKTTIASAFGSDHILSHRQYLKNAVTDGYESGGSWYDSTVELMTEQNVYGGKVFGNCLNGTAIPASYTVDKSQYPLFTFRPDLISNRQTYWLRDVVSAALFANVGTGGGATYNSASPSLGVRPAFSIKS